MLADFKNTIIIMTSNIGSHIIHERFEATKDIESAIEAAKSRCIGLTKTNCKT